MFSEYKQNFIFEVIKMQNFLASQGRRLRPARPRPQIWGPIQNTPPRLYEGLVPTYCINPPTRKFWQAASATATPKQCCSNNNVVILISHYGNFHHHSIIL